MSRKLCVISILSLLACITLTSLCLLYERFGMFLVCICITLITFGHLAYAAYEERSVNRSHIMGINPAGESPSSTSIGIPMAATIAAITLPQLSEAQLAETELSEVQVAEPQLPDGGTNSITMMALHTSDPVATVDPVLTMDFSGHSSMIGANAFTSDMGGIGCDHCGFDSSMDFSMESSMGFDSCTDMDSSF